MRRNALSRRITPMSDLLTSLTAGISLTGDLEHDVLTFLAHHDCPRTAAHSADVAAEAARVAARIGADRELAAQAGWLHDISAVFPTSTRAQVARTFGVEILPEEDAFPLIIHQKLSVVLARGIFEIIHPEVLSAVGCHTTLKANASQLDKVLFVADKLAWDKDSTPPYRDALLAALEQSLDAAALCYLRYVWERRATLKVIHPWLEAAYHDCLNRTKDEGRK